MATKRVWMRSVKKRLRAARDAASLLDQELIALVKSVPCPNEEEFREIVSGKSPLTLELLLVGLVNLGHFHVSEGWVNLILALEAADGKEKPGHPTWRLRDDFCNSLANVLARSTKGKAPRASTTEGASE